MVRLERNPTALRFLLRHPRMLGCLVRMIDSSPDLANDGGRKHELVHAVAVAYAVATVKDSAVRGKILAKYGLEGL